MRDMKVILIKFAFHSYKIITSYLALNGQDVANSMETTFDSQKNIDESKIFKILRRTI